MDLHVSPWSSEHSSFDWIHQHDRGLLDRAQLLLLVHAIHIKGAAGEKYFIILYSILFISSICTFTGIVPPKIKILSWFTFMLFPSFYSGTKRNWKKACAFHEMTINADGCCLASNMAQKHCQLIIHFIPSPLKSCESFVWEKSLKFSCRITSDLKYSTHIICTAATAFLLHGEQKRGHSAESVLLRKGLRDWDLVE